MSDIISCKVVLLGESGVGKTSIISRYLSNTFEENNMSTTGASFAGKQIYFEEYQKSLKFEIWDTAGQEKYRSLTKIFYKDASIAILVYDITRKESFDELKNYWFTQIKEYAPKDTIIAIAANKSDLFEKEQVSEGDARDFAKCKNALFRTTSAKNACGIDDLFRTIGCKYLDPNFNDEGDDEPKNDTKPVGESNNNDYKDEKKNNIKLTAGDKNGNGQEKKKCC